MEEWVVVCAAALQLACNLQYIFIRMETRINTPTTGCCPRCFLMNFGTVSGYLLALLQALRQAMLTLRCAGGQVWGEETKSLKCVRQLFPNASISHVDTLVAFC